MLPQTSRLALTVAALPLLAACAATPPFAQPDRTADTGLRVAVVRSVPVPAGTAHTTFQHGRARRGANLFEPYCQLELQEVADQSRSVPPAEYRVFSTGTRVLQDPVTGIPALGIYAGPGGINCDPLYQESVLRLTTLSPPDAVPLRRLRCIAPYQDCRLGPPLSLDQMQLAVGSYLSISRAAD